MVITTKKKIEKWNLKKLCPTALTLEKKDLRLFNDPDGL
jgi:hypothetical protein